MMTTTLSDILEPGDPEMVATGFEFTEGPLWRSDNVLYVSDVDARIHYSVDLATGAKTVIRTGSGGANGATFDMQGRLVMCEQDSRRVVRVSDDGPTAVIAATYQGKRINRANDLVCRSDGSIYFTDPQGLMPEEEKELGHSALFQIGPAGGLALLASDMNHPNGLAFSPDESILYVSNSRPDPHLHAYDVNADGSLSRSRVLSEMPYIASAPGETFRTHSGALRPAAERGGVPDGLKVDMKGRIFCTGPGGVWVFKPDGTSIGIIETPELPANVAFGGPDHRTLFITARSSVYRVRVRTPGVAAPGPQG